MTIKKAMELFMDARSLYQDAIEYPDRDYYDRAENTFNNAMKELKEIVVAGECSECQMPLPSGCNLCAACGHKLQVLASSGGEIIIKAIMNREEPYHPGDGGC